MYVITNDINYICSELNKKGEESTREIFSKVEVKDSPDKSNDKFDQDASKLHLVPSAQQRPLDHQGNSHIILKINIALCLKKQS